MHVQVAALELHLVLATARFTADLSEFLLEHAGERAMHCAFQTRDRDSHIIFGGKQPHSESAHSRPIILVSQPVDDRSLLEIRNTFLSNGYSETDIYSLGHSSSLSDIIHQDTPLCDFFRQKGILITAVANYTNAQMNVVAILSTKPAPRLRKYLQGCNGLSTHSLTSTVRSVQVITREDRVVTACYYDEENCVSMASTVCGLKITAGVEKERSKMTIPKRNQCAPHCRKFESPQRGDWLRDAALWTMRRLQHMDAVPLKGRNYTASLNAEGDNVRKLTDVNRIQRLLRRDTKGTAEEKTSEGSVKSSNHSQWIPEITKNQIPTAQESVTTPVSVVNPSVPGHGHRPGEANSFDPFIVICFVFLALAFFLYKFLSRCICDRK